MLRRKKKSGLDGTRRGKKAASTVATPSCKTPEPTLKTAQRAAGEYVLEEEPDGRYRIVAERITRRKP